MIFCEFELISDPTVKTKAQQTLLAMTTKNARGSNQPGTIKVNQTALNTNRNFKPMMDWATPIIEKILSPIHIPQNPAPGATGTTLTGANPSQPPPTQPLGASGPGHCAPQGTLTGTNPSQGQTQTVTWADQQRAVQTARHIAIFTEGAATTYNNIYGTPPPAKQAKLEPVGISSLSIYTKQRLMSFSRAQTINDLSPSLLALLNQRSSDRLGYFNNFLLPKLVAKDGEAFAGFLFTGEFVEDLCNGKLTTHESTDNWWDGFVGHILRRDPAEIRNINKLFKASHSSALQLHLTPGNLVKLDTKAPVPIKDMPELLRFLRRANFVLEEFFPESYLRRTIEYGYNSLIRRGRHVQLQNDNNWLNKKPREIEWSLVELEQAE